MFYCAKAGTALSVEMPQKQNTANWEGISKKELYYRHLQYCNCGSIIGEEVLTIGSPNIEKVFLKNFPELFAEGTTEVQVKETLLQQGDFMEKLFDVWNNSEMGSFILTTVGIAIAVANIKRKTGVYYDLLT